MKSRIITGILLIFLGLFLMFVPMIFNEGSFIIWFYGIPILILGIAVLFNKNEDKIEEIKKSKGGVR